MIIQYLRLFCKSIDKINIFIANLASYLMPLLAFVVFFEVVSRYIFNSPTIWSYDVALFLFGYIASLGAANAQYKKKHITVDIIYKKVSAKTKNIFNLVSYSLAVFFLIILFYTVVMKLNEALQYDFRRQGEWGPQMWHFWLMLCISSALLILQFTRDIIVELYYLITKKQLIQKDCSND